MQKTRCILLLAVGSVALAAAPAMVCAQYQTSNNTGRLNDANNRLGSDGVNDARHSVGGYTPDDVAFGTVTRGREFRANATPDPRAFHGTINQPSSDFVRDAGPSVYERSGNLDPYGAQRYWGDKQGTNPPPGFGQLTPGSPGAFQVVKPNVRVPGDLRLDAAIPNPDMSLPQPGEMSLPGPVNTTAAANPNSDMALLQPNLAASAVEQMPTQQVLQHLQLDESKIRQMRDELRKSSEDENPDQQGTTPTQQRLNADDLTAAPENPINDPLNSRVRSNLRQQPLQASADTLQSQSQTLVTATPSAARQSSQYAELEKRLERFRERQKMTDQQANAQFLKEWNAAQQAKREEQAKKQQQTLKPQEPQGQNPQAQATQTPAQNQDDQDMTGSHGGLDRAHLNAKAQTQMPQNKVEGVLPPQPELPPLKITSFADGVKASGLKQLLTSAEKNMADGKFTQALDYYDAAGSVAPNNPLITTGRSVAELGAGYYARAQTHLEQVLNADPALLMARYDLKSFYGEDRLQYIVRDLKDVAQAEQKQARPLFLLAFIAYNTDNPQRASDYLDMAQARGGNKQFYDKLREYWKLNNKDDEKAGNK